MLTKILSKIMTIFMMVLIAMLVFLAIVFVIDIICDLFGWLFKTENYKIISGMTDSGDPIYSRVDLFALLVSDSYMYMIIIIPFALLTSITMWVKSKALKNYDEVNELP